MIPAALTHAQFVGVPAGEKSPAVKGWPEIHLSADQVRKHLDAGGNLAIKVGVCSGNIVDVDLDCIEAIALANLYLPPTYAVFGRASKPRSHRLYVAPGAFYTAFADPLAGGDTLLELRSDGRT